MRTKDNIIQESPSNHDSGKAHYLLAQPECDHLKEIKPAGSNLYNSGLLKVPNKVHSKLINSYVMKIKWSILNENEYSQSTMKKFCVSETLQTKLLENNV